MKKMIFLVFIALVGVVSLNSCQKVKQDDSTKSSQNFSEEETSKTVNILEDNLAAFAEKHKDEIHERSGNEYKFVIVDAKVRKINDTGYKREMFIKFYSESKLSYISFEGEVFTDDGTFGDEIADDGYFTSVNTYEISSNPDIKPFDEYSVGHFIGYSDNLELSDDVMESLESLVVSTGSDAATETGGSSGDLFKIKLKCKVGTCSCSPECHCPACDYEWTSVGCFYLYDCEATIEIGW